MTSILVDIKHALGINPPDTSFDTELGIHINSVLLSLRQIGIGEPEGLDVKDDSVTWEDLTSDIALLSAVKSYILLKVKIVFDPPTNSFVLDALNREIQEYAWRLNLEAENLSLGLE